MSDDVSSDEDFELGFEPAVGQRGAPSVNQPAVESSSQTSAKVTRRRGGSKLRRKVTGVAVLVAALTSVGGGYALLAPSSGAADTAVNAADVEKGRQLFQTSCITCHGANLQGVTGRGPSLIGVGAASAYFQVSTGRMPAVAQGADNPRKTPAFTEEQTQWIAAYVGSIGGGPNVPTENLVAGSKQLAEGGQLFRLNCASCHGATAKGAPLSAGKVAPSLNKATATQLWTAMLSGPANMPVFSDNQITPEQKAAIVAYVENLRASKDPGGAGLDRIGPVSEGLVIWTLGLGALMVAILWIGRKS